MKKYYALYLLSALLMGCKSSPDKVKPGVPNVIIVLTDDQGYHDVGFNGCTDIPTPNLDRIANEGVKFTNGYVSFAVCGPSRAGLLTGRYQDRFGFNRNPLFAPNDSLQGLPVREETLGAAMHQAGYRTMAIGKWHMGAHKSQRPLQRGFDEFFGFLTGGHKYFPEEWTLDDISGVNSQYAAYKTKLLKNDARVDEKEYLTDALTREAVSFIERNASHPFFLYLAYNAPHQPLEATQKYLNRFPNITNKKRKTYAAMVSSVDDGVGRLLDKLSELKIDENTMIFYLSDNGGPYKKNGSRNDPLREGKGSLYDGGIRVPFAMRWPAMLAGGQVYDHPIISLDIFATASYFADAHPIHPLDGVNIVPFILGKKKGVPHTELFWRKFDSQSYAVRSGDYKLVNMNDSQDEVYRIKEDIGEKRALADTIKLQELLKAKDAWMKQLKDPVFLGLRQNSEYNATHPHRFEIAPY